MVLQKSHGLLFSSTLLKYGIGIYPAVINTLLERTLAY